jgi:natural product precursor
MKKLNSAKLQLNRETLRSLEQSQLKDVDGGASATPSCELTSCNGCNTRNTCTTRFC